MVAKATTGGTPGQFRITRRRLVVHLSTFNQALSLVTGPCGLAPGEFPVEAQFTGFQQGARGATLDANNRPSWREKITICIGLWISLTHGLTSSPLENKYLLYPRKRRSTERGPGGRGPGVVPEGVGSKNRGGHVRVQIEGRDIATLSVCVFRKIL
jgi:hypothetical protein